MKKTKLLLLLLLFFKMGHAQSNVVDVNQASKLFFIDFDRGEETLAVSENAILFKNAIIELVYNTPVVRQLQNMYPGPKIAVIKQIDPKVLNGYQITLKRTSFNSSSTIAWFYYDIKKNSLFVFDQDIAKWSKVILSSENLQLLTNCQSYCNFNSRQGQGSEMAMKSLQDLVVNDN